MFTHGTIHDNLVLKLNKNIMLYVTIILKKNTIQIVVIKHLLFLITNSKFKSKMSTYQKLIIKNIKHLHIMYRLCFINIFSKSRIMYEQFFYVSFIVDIQAVITLINIHKQSQYFVLL